MYIYKFMYMYIYIYIYIYVNKSVLKTTSLFVNSLMPKTKFLKLFYKFTWGQKILSFLLKNFFCFR